MIVLALRYAFNELSLHRVWLTTSGFSERALNLYEKLGFRHEGEAASTSCWTAGGRTSFAWGCCGTSSS
jgi:RimJ/RimL family protein N-acetyltransferase